MTTQFEIDFQPGLLELFPSFREVVAASVASCGRPHKHVAADLDMTSQELSRKLADNPNDPVNFPMQKLPDLIKATGDLRPVYWLVEMFCDTAGNKQKRAMSQLAALMPELHRLVKQAAPT